MFLHRSLWILYFISFSIVTNAQIRSGSLDAVMKRYYASANEPGAALLIGKDKEIVFQKGYGLANLETSEAITPQTYFRMASVSKQFTAMRVFLLIEKGSLSWDTPLNRIFQALPQAIQAITVRQLLNHTSGIWDYEPLIPDTQRAQIQDADVLELIKQKDETYFTPGTQFKYSNTGYCLLSLVVEQVSGLPYADFVKQYIFQPLGMDGAVVYESGIFIMDRAYGYHPIQNRFTFADQSLTSATKGDGGIYLSAQAYARWARGLMSNSLVSKAYWDALKSVQMPVQDGIAYSLGWFMGKEADGSMALFHSGESTGFHNIVYLNPKTHLYIVLFTNRDDMRIAHAFDEIAEIMKIKPLPDQKPIMLFNWLNRVYTN